MFEYSVTDADGNEYDDVDPVGTHAANAVDENGCVVDSAFQVMAPDSILFDIVIEDVTCNGEANGSICVENATGGTGALVSMIRPGRLQFDPCFTLVVRML